MEALTLSVLLIMVDWTTYACGVLEGTSPSLQHLVCGTLSPSPLIQLLHGQDVLFPDPFQRD